MKFVFAIFAIAAILVVINAKACNNVTEVEAARLKREACNNVTNLEAAREKRDVDTVLPVNEEPAELVQAPKEKREVPCNNATAVQAP